MIRSAPFARPIVFTAPELIRNVSGSISVPEVRRIHIEPYLSAAPQLISTQCSVRPRRFVAASQVCRPEGRSSRKDLRPKKDFSACRAFLCDLVNRLERLPEPV